jgi:hypothetical protein
MLVRLIVLLCAGTAAIGVGLGAPAPHPRGAPGTRPRAPTARPRSSMGTLGPYLQRRPSQDRSRPPSPSHHNNRDRYHQRFYSAPYYYGPAFLYPWGSFYPPGYSFYYYQPLVPAPVYIPWVPAYWPDYLAPDEWSTSGNVQLQVQPAKVTVTVDGIPIASGGQSILSVPTGVHHFEIARPGYRPWILDLDVKQGVRYRLEPRLEPVPQDQMGPSGKLPPTGRTQARQVGELRLDIRPADASVELDGQLMGRVDLLQHSDALRQVPVGHHRVRFSRPGYKTTEREIEITAAVLHR